MNELRTNFPLSELDIFNNFVDYFGDYGLGWLEIIW